MKIRAWEELPDELRVPEVRPYYEILRAKRVSLAIKRAFDLGAGAVLTVLLALPMGAIAVCIKLDSKGPVFFRQERVTSYGRRFRIHKFRTMVVDADKLGSAVTVKHDSRVTKVGSTLRRYRLDELPQLFDVLRGDMSFVGTRPEVPRYVERYLPEMRATLLLPAGITSEASIRYKDEERLLSGADDVDRVYLEQVLPEKMRWNLESLRRFSLLRESATMVRTVFAVLRKDRTTQ